MTFFTEFLRNPRQNASIVPSAPAACEKMFEGLDMASMQYVVELGPGTGCFTRELMAQLPSSARVLMLEINPTFCPRLEQEYGHRFHVRQESAHRMDELVAELGWPRIDLVVSGLPYTLPDVVIDPLFESLKRRTREGTTYRFFTYVPPLMKRKYEPSGFDLTLEHVVVKNVPPMWIYSAKASQPR
jgi:phospholipid N-methyltransferase